MLNKKRLKIAKRLSSNWETINWKSNWIWEFQ